jgi:hypothetical protein
MVTAYERGKLAYDAYSKEVGGVSAVTGDTLPAFDDTGEVVQSGWIAAAAAVAAEVPNAEAPVPREVGDERG